MIEVIGYDLSGQDNDTYMFEPKEPEIDRCRQCGYRLEFFVTNPEYVPKKNARDLSSTYDGQWIVSKAFKQVCTQQSYSGLNFKEFLRDKNHFHFVVDPIVRFDATKRKTRFERLCPLCRNYESIVGATPAFLLIPEPLRDGFYRSDLLFGSGDSKHPSIFVAPETKSTLQAAGLKGLEFSPAYGMQTDVEEIKKLRLKHRRSSSRS